MEIIKTKKQVKNFLNWASYTGLAHLKTISETVDSLGTNHYGELKKELAIVDNSYPDTLLRVYLGYNLEGLSLKVHNRIHRVGGKLHPLSMWRSCSIIPKWGFLEI